MDVLLLTESDIQALLDLEELLDALASGFKALHTGQAVVPNRNALSVSDAGLLLVMPAWQPSQNMTVKLVTVFPGNHAIGLPSHQALIWVFDPQTGTPVALMDGTYITAMRTAGAAALSAKLFARKHAHVLAIIGAGIQGHAHLKILPRVCGFKEIRVASRHFENAQKLAAMHFSARAAESIEEAVRGADVVCLCTASKTPVIEFEWLSPGTHITSVGYTPPGGELPKEVVLQGRLFVETRLAFEPVPAGCAELAGLNPEIGTEMGEVLLGTRPGRQSDDEITVYKSMGHAIEDMAAANLTYRRAKKQGVGKMIKL